MKNWWIKLYICGVLGIGIGMGWVLLVLWAHDADGYPTQYTDVCR